MREIKFRAWDKQYNFMIQPDDIRPSNYEIITGEGEVMEFSENHSYLGTSVDWDDISDKRVLMQYTGLKDKNGKEIYEGDIVEYNEKGRHEVTFEDGMFVISRQNLKTCVVIGNIYENPELIK